MTDSMLQQHNIHGHAQKMWQDEVVQKWFSNEEPASKFLCRANIFLGRHVIDGFRIFEKVVKIKSYAAFMTMSKWSSTLLFAYLDVRTCEEGSAPGAAGSNSAFLHGFGVFVSSSNQVFASTKENMPAPRAMTIVRAGLKCLSRLSVDAWATLGPSKSLLAFYGRAEQSDEEALGV